MNHQMLHRSRLQRFFTSAFTLCAAGLLLAGALRVQAAAPGPRSATVGQEVFLGGNFLELGINLLGSFGTSVAKPAGFLGTTNYPSIGMSTDPDGYGVGTDQRFDFFFPGTPYVAWFAGYKLGGVPTTGVNNTDERTGTMPTTVADLSSGTNLMARSTATLGGNLQIVQTVSFSVDQRFYKVVVGLTNIGAAAIDNVRYVFEVNPDNTVDIGGNYATRNVILNTFQAGDPRAVVEAQSVARDAVQTKLPLVSTDNRARVSFGGILSPDQLGVYAPRYYDSARAKGDSAESNNTVSIACDVGTLAPGQGSTFTYYVGLGDVLQEIEVAASTSALEISARLAASPVAAGGTYDFGNVPVGTTPTPVSLRVASLGTDPVTVTNITMTPPGEFSVPAVFPVTLAGKGGEFSVPVSFTPSAGGTRTAVMSIISGDATRNPYTITLTGRGLVPETEVTLDGGSTATVTDINGGNSDDQLHLLRVSTTLSFSDPNLVIRQAGQPGPFIRTLSVPFASAANGLTFDLLGGSDQLLLDQNGGELPAATIAAGSGADTVTVTNGSAQSAIQLAAVSYGSGSLSGTLGGTLSYTGLETLVYLREVTDVSATFGASAETIVVAALAGGVTKIDSSQGTEVRLRSVRGMVTILAGSGDDAIQVEGAAFGGGLTLDGQVGNNSARLSGVINSLVVITNVGATTVGDAGQLSLRLSPSQPSVLVHAGTVNLASVPVTTTIDAPPTLGQVIMLVDKRSAGPVSGQFQGLTEGGTVAAGGNLFAISYVGGDGNDVTLTSIGPASPAPWTPSLSDTNWSRIASSTNGTKLVATVDDGQIYTSANSGATWVARETKRKWSGVASSADGTRLVAVVNEGLIYTSSNSGETWIPRESSRKWTGVASSSDGLKLVAAASSDRLYISADGGATWTAREETRNWTDTASSADGTVLYATDAGPPTVLTGGFIYVSTDSGTKWTARGPSKLWSRIDASADGRQLIALPFTGFIFGAYRLQLSSDFGVTWTEREEAREWKDVGISGDGSRMIAVEYVGGFFGGGVPGRIHISRDSGASWTPQESPRNWGCAAISADGTKLAAAVIGGQIYTSAFPLQEVTVEWPVANALVDGGVFSFGSLTTPTTNRTFFIRNIGQENLTGLNATIDGADAAMFTVTAQPALATLPGALGYTTFTVRFTPTALGTRTAALHLASNDGDENPFDLILTGGSPTPTLQLLGSNLLITNNDATPRTADGTDFGTFDAGKTNANALDHLKTFTFTNAGSGFLVVSNVSLSSTTTGFFPVFTNLLNGNPTLGFPFTLAPGQTTNLNVACFPPAYVAGPQTVEVQITSNDPLTPVYRYNLQASVNGVSAVKALQAYLKGGTTAAGGQLGHSVAIAGDTAVVGMPYEASGVGAAYIYVRSAGVWTQQGPKLTASNPEANDKFGYSVSITGDTVAIGAPGEASNATGVNGSQSDNSASSAGAVYVFTRNGTTWSQQAYLKASNTGANDNFGGAVAVAGDTLAVGAPREDGSTPGVNGLSNESATDSGAAYVFTRSGTTWSQQAYLKASNPGGAVEDFMAMPPVFTYGDSFGTSVAISGDTVVVGATGESSSTTGFNPTPNESATDAGAAYVFTRSGTTWSQQAFLKASNAGSADGFGNAVAISGDTVVVGASNEASSSTTQTDNNAFGAGAAYVFTRSVTTWTQQAYLKASNPGSSDNFGSAVAIATDTVVVGAKGEDSSSTGVGSTPNELATDSGAAYVFTRSGVTWSQQSYLKASNPGGGVEDFMVSPPVFIYGDAFGSAVAISGDTVLVGSPNEASNATGVNAAVTGGTGTQADNSAAAAGAAYVYNGFGSALPANSAPTGLALSGTVLGENNLAGATIGTVSATDSDSGQTLTYSLVAGAGSTDNTAFTLTGTTLTINGTTDFEARSSYTVRLRATDNGTGPLNVENLFTITITNVNEAPTGIALSAASIAENNAANATVGTLSATDPDAANTFTYTLATGTGSADNTAFNLSGDSLRLTASANFELKNSYSVRVRSTDQGGLFFEKPFTVTIMDVNEAPTLAAIGVSGFEDTTLTFTAANFTGAYTDPETTALASLQIKSLPASGTLKLSGTDVTVDQVIPLANLGSLTYVPVLNENGAKTFTGSASDGALSSPVATVTMTITAANDAPSFSIPGQSVRLKTVINDQFGDASPALNPSGTGSGFVDRGQFPGSETGGALVLNSSVNSTTVYTSAVADAVNPFQAIPATVTYTFGAIEHTGSLPRRLWVGYRRSGDTTPHLIGLVVPGLYLSVLQVGDVYSNHGNLVAVSSSGVSSTLATWNWADPNQLSGLAVTLITSATTYELRFSGAAGGTPTFVTGAATGALTGLGTISGNFDVGIHNQRNESTANPSAVSLDSVLLQAPVLAPHDIPVAAGAPAQSVANFATGFSPGPANESVQTLLGYTVSVESGKTGLFSAAPTIANDGTLTFAPATGSGGSALITVVAQDNGGTDNGGVDKSTNTFTITVYPSQIVVNNATELAAAIAAAGPSGTTITLSANMDLAGLGPITKNVAFTAGGGVTLTGTLQVGSGGTVSLGGGTFPGASITVQSGGTLTGSGSFNGTLLVQTGGKVSPGTSPGTITADSGTWAGGGSYDWEINNASGAPGTTDLLTFNNALTVTATAGNPFVVRVKTLTAANLPGLLPGNGVHDMR